MKQKFTTKVAVGLVDLDIRDVVTSAFGKLPSGCLLAQVVTAAKQACRSGSGEGGRGGVCRQLTLLGSRGRFDAVDMGTDAPEVRGRVDTHRGCKRYVPWLGGAESVSFTIISCRRWFRQIMAFLVNEVDANLKNGLHTKAEV